MAVIRPCGLSTGHSASMRAVLTRPSDLKFRFTKVRPHESQREVKEHELAGGSRPESAVF
jgi:hypothetical protein